MVVASVAVPVMDNFAGSQWSSDLLFRNDTVQMPLVELDVGLAFTAIAFAVSRLLPGNELLSASK